MKMECMFSDIDSRPWRVAGKVKATACLELHPSSRSPSGLVHLHFALVPNIVHRLLAFAQSRQLA
jgi:hypothetical protein